MSGGLIGGVIGGVIGFFVGGPTGAMYGFEIGAAAGGMLFPGSLPDQFGPRLNDLKVQISTYGTTIPIVYGRARISGNVIWCTDLVEHSNTQDQGGKGGPSQSVTTYSYSISAAVSICEGPIIGVRRIWADSTLIYDVSTTNTGPTSPDFATVFHDALASISGSSGSSQQSGNGFVVYLGDENQVPDPTIEAHLGAGNVPAYRGQAYIVFTDFPLEKFGNRLPTFSFEVLAEGAPQSVPTNFMYPNATDGGYGYLYTDWLYNPLLNEIWALGNGFSASSRYVNPIIRINPDNGSKIGEIRWEKSLPDTGQYGQAVEMVYNASDKCVYLNNADVQPTTSICKLDAGTGAVVNNVAGVTYQVGNVNTYDGTVWFGDASNTHAIYQVKQDLTVKTHITGLSFNYGPMTFSADGIVYVSDFHLLDIWQFTSSGAFTRLTPSGWTYLGYTWYVADIAYDPGRDVIWAFARNANTIGASTLVYIFEFSRVDGSIITAHQIASGSVIPLDSMFNEPGGNPDEKFYDSAMDAFWITERSNPDSAANGVIKCLRASDFSQIVNASTQVDTVFYGAPFNHSKIGTLYYVGWQNDPSINYLVPAKLVYNRLGTGSTTLAAIIADVSERTTQLTNTDIDVSGQSGVIVDGYVISRQTSGRSVIEQLQQAYFFDMVESDDKVKFVNRGSGSIITIPDDDLAAFEAAQNPGDDLAITREMESTLPQALNINYMAESADYQTGTQQSRRLVGATGNLNTFDLPIVLSDDKAKQVVDAAMYALWTSRTTYKFTTTNKYAKYEPTDVVTVKGKLLRITKRTDNNGVISWEGVQEEGQIYTQTLPGTITAFTPQTIASPVFTDLELLDINLLRDADDDAGFYYAAEGYTAGWPGMALFKSSDSGASYANIGALTTGTTIGRANGVLGNFTGGNIFDYTNSLTVSLIGTGTLSSNTMLAVLNGANAALVGSEVIQYLTAVLNADGTYTLSGLLRGRRGTDWAIGTHTSGERFIALSLSTVARAIMTTAEIGLARLYKGVTIGDSLDNTTTQTFTNSASGLKPYSPTHLSISRDGSNNITATWIRRTRIGGEWRDYVDAALGESSELYDVEIWDSSYSTLKRTFSGLTSASASYTAAQQVTDFGSTQSTVYLRIYQISATVGRGYKLEDHG